MHINAEVAEVAPDTPAAEVPSGEVKAAKRGKTAKKTRTVELTLTVTGTADGEWQADLVHAGRRIAQGISISASTVAKAVSEFPLELAKPINEAIDTARELHRTRVEELEAQLAKAKAALEELSS